MVVEYQSVSVSVFVSASVSVSVSKLKMHLHGCNSHWKLFSKGHFSVSASTRKLNPIDCECQYGASMVEEWSGHHSSFTEQVHTVQHQVMLTGTHGRGVHILHAFTATIATASLCSLLSQVSYPAHSSGPTTALPGGIVSVCRHLWSIHGSLPAHFSYTAQILYCMLKCSASHQRTICKIDSNRFHCWAELLREYWPKLLKGCRHDVEPNDCKMALCTRP